MDFASGGIDSVIEFLIEFVIEAEWSAVQCGTMLEHVLSLALSFDRRRRVTTLALRRRVSNRKKFGIYCALLPPPNERRQPSCPIKKTIYEEKKIYLYDGRKK